MSGGVFTRSRDGAPSPSFTHALEDVEKKKKKKISKGMLGGQRSNSLRQATNEYAPLDTAQPSLGVADYRSQGVQVHDHHGDCLLCDENVQPLPEN